MTNVSSLLGPLIILITYVIVSALHRLWSFEIHYNYDQIRSQSYLSNKEYLLSVIQTIFKLFYVDIDGRRFPRIRKHLSSFTPPERLESIFRLQRPHALLIMVFSIILFIFFVIVSYSSFSKIVWGPFLAPLFKTVSILLAVFVVCAIFYNIFDYMAFKILVVHHACQSYLERIKNKGFHEMTKHLPDKITYGIEIWTGYPTFGDIERKILMKEEIKNSHEQGLQIYENLTSLKPKNRLDTIMWNILGFFFTHREGLTYIVFYVVFGLIVSKSFNWINFLTNFSEPDTLENTKKALGFIIGRLTALSLGSLSLVLCYLGALWGLYVGVEYFGGRFLKGRMNTYKSEKEEYEFDEGQKEWVKKHDFSHIRHIINMFCLLFKKSYVKVKRETVAHTYVDENDEIQYSFLTDYKALDKYHFTQQFLQFDFKKTFNEIFLRKICFPTIFLYIIAFFVLMIFVTWYESNPQRHQHNQHNQQHINASDILDKDANDVDNEHINTRIKRYIYLYQTFIIITGGIIGCILIYHKLLKKENLMISQELYNSFYKILFNISTYVFVICVLTFFLFYDL